jgi:uncharacterized membrane protein
MTPLSDSSPHVEFQQVSSIISTRCLACHSSHPTDDVFTVAPKGLSFESEAQFRAVLPTVYEQVVVGKTMPLGNKTGMTDSERAIFAQWVNQELGRH